MAHGQEVFAEVASQESGSAGNNGSWHGATLGWLSIEGLGSVYSGADGGHRPPGWRGKNDDLPFPAGAETRGRFIFEGERLIVLEYSQPFADTLLRIIETDINHFMRQRPVPPAARHLVSQPGRRRLHLSQRAAGAPIGSP